jgi:glycosyltransferase involved in cell wall biosynthesis
LRLWDAPNRVASSSQNKTIVLFVGAAFQRKGGDVLAQVAMRDEFRSTEFHFVTKEFEGPTASNIVIHADLTANDERLVRLYRGADVFVLPTTADSHSIASLEAMAMRLPVIGTRVGGIEDIILEGQNGFYVKPGDVEGFANRLGILIQDPEMRTRMGYSARKRVEEKFNLENISSRVVEIMAEAARERQGIASLAKTLR